jgi:Acetyltransferase (GNAT) family.
MKYRSTLNSPVGNQKIIRLIEELESKRTKKEIELNRDLVEFDILGNETNLELYSIVVEKDYRGIGIGTEAVKKL